MKCLKATLAAGMLAVCPAAVGDTEPVTDFKARDLDNKMFRLRDHLDRGPVLLDFWALWCVPCLKELPELEKIWNRYRQQGLTLIAINEDSPSDQSKVRPYVKRKRFRFPVVVDEDKDLWYQFKVTSLPSVFLLDSKGRTVYSHTGYRAGDEARLAARIEQLLSPPLE